MEPRATVIKNAFDLAHMVFNMVTGDLDETTAAFEMPGGMVPSATAMMAHSIFGEDMMVSAVLERPTLLETSGIGAKSGLIAPGPSMTPEFLAQAFDLAGLREYGAAVFAQTDSALESASAAQLDRQLPTPMGSQMDAASFLAAFAIVHLAQHTGDISALKGAQGLKGLPF